MQGHTSLVGLVQFSSLSFIPKSPSPYTENEVVSPPTKPSSPLSPTTDYSTFHTDRSSHRKFEHPIVMSASADGTLRLWDPVQGKSISTLHGHPAPITCFQFDQYKCISGSNRVIKLWDLRYGGGVFVY